MMRCAQRELDEASAWKQHGAEDCMILQPWLRTNIEAPREIHAARERHDRAEERMKRRRETRNVRARRDRHIEPETLALERVGGERHGAAVRQEARPIDGT